MSKKSKRSKVKDTIQSKTNSKDVRYLEKYDNHAIKGDEEKQSPDFNKDENQILQPSTSVQIDNDKH